MSWFGCQYLAVLCFVFFGFLCMLVGSCCAPRHCQFRCCEAVLGGAGLAWAVLSELWAGLGCAGRAGCLSLACSGWAELGCATHPAIYLSVGESLCALSGLALLRWRNLGSPLERIRWGCSGLFRARLGLAALACAVLCQARLLARAGLGWAGLGVIGPMHVGVGVLVWVPALGTSVFSVYGFSVHAGGLLLPSSALLALML